MAAFSATNESLRGLGIADAAMANSHDAVVPPENAIATLPDKPGATRKNPPRHAVSLAVASAALLLLLLAFTQVIVSLPLDMRLARQFSIDRLSLT